MSAEGTTDPQDLAEAVSAAVEGVPGVSGLYGGAFGEIATYLPGRRIAGIRIGESDGEVHITVDLTSGLLKVAEEVHLVASATAGRPMSVVVEDVTAAVAPG